MGYLSVLGNEQFVPARGEQSASLIRACAGKRAPSAYRHWQHLQEMQVNVPKHMGTAVGGRLALWTGGELAVCVWAAGPGPGAETVQTASGCWLCTPVLSVVGARWVSVCSFRWAGRQDTPFSAESFGAGASRAGLWWRALGIGSKRNCWSQGCSRCLETSAWWLDPGAEMRSQMAPGWALG